MRLSSTHNLDRAATPVARSGWGTYVNEKAVRTQSCPPVKSALQYRERERPENVNVPGCADCQSKWKSLKPGPVHYRAMLMSSELKINLNVEDGPADCRATRSQARTGTPTGSVSVNPVAPGCLIGPAAKPPAVDTRRTAGGAAVCMCYTHTDRTDRDIDKYWEGIKREIVVRNREFRLTRNRPAWSEIPGPICRNHVPMGCCGFRQNGKTIRQNGTGNSLS